MHKTFWRRKSGKHNYTNRYVALVMPIQIPFCFAHTERKRKAANKKFLLIGSMSMQFGFKPNKELSNSSFNKKRTNHWNSKLHGNYVKSGIFLLLKMCFPILREKCKLTKCVKELSTASHCAILTQCQQFNQQTIFICLLFSVGFFFHKHFWCFVRMKMSHSLLSS